MKQQYPTDNSNLGYEFTHEQHTVESGFPNLRVYLRETPSETHFDPETVRFTSVMNGKSNKVVLRHPTQHHGELQVLPGRVVLTDRRGQRVEFFTFGGTLLVDSETDFVGCTFKSDAPIFLFNERETARALFAEDAEIMLAERRASYVPHEEEFDNRLVHVAPFTLFITVLHTLFAKLEKQPYKRVKRLLKLHQYVTENLRLLRGSEMRAAGSQTLDDIL